MPGQVREGHGAEEAQGGRAPGQGEAVLRGRGLQVSHMVSDNQIRADGKSQVRQCLGFYLPDS